MKLHTSRTIKAPLEEVFAFFVDFPESAKVLHSAFHTEFVTPQTTGLGAEWMQYDEDPANPTISRHKIIAFDPPRSYTMTSDDKAALETMEFRFTDLGGKTQVDFELDIQPKSFFIKLVTSLLRRMIVKAMSQDLDRIVAAIELLAPEKRP